MITIVDYGLGNLNSIQNMLKYIGVESMITGIPEDIAKASKLILPGVGRFGAGMKGIKEKGLTEILNQKALDEKVPVLGICLGMQLLTKGSEEDDSEGLGWIDAYAVKFQAGGGYKVPHMGWNEVHVVNDNPLIADTEAYNKFYFVHSYYVKTAEKRETIFETEHNVRFASGIGKDNIMGVQFHPEKSHKYGMHLLKKFVEM